MRHDAESGQTILSGMGELQLEVSLEKLRARHGVQVSVGRPQVAYRETITRAAQVNHLHKKQTGGPGQFAELTLRLAPLARGAKASGSRAGSSAARSRASSSRRSKPACAARRRRAWSAATHAWTSSATLVDGAHHERDSSTLAFELAAAAAFREAAAQAGPQLLEPVMAVEVVTPPEYLGDCIGDLQRRRGTIHGQQSRGGSAVLTAQVPLKEMFGYIGSLRALSSGRAQYSMQFDHYAPVG